MLELWTTYSSNLWIRLDLYEYEAVNLNLQFTNISDISKQQGGYTRAFRIPYTKQNGNVLEGAQRIGDGVLSYGNYGANGLSPSQKKAAVLVNSGMVVRRGYLKLQGAYRVKGEIDEIELVFMEEEVGLLREAREKPLSDYLDDLTFDYANITSSFDGNYLNGKYKFVVAHKGNDWNTDGDLPTTAGNALPQGGMTPAVNALMLLQEIVEDLGYELESNFMLFGGGANPYQFQRIHMLLGNGGALLKAQGTLADQRAVAVLDAPWQPSTSYQKIPFKDNVGDGYDNAGNWGNSSYWYNIDYSGTYRIWLYWKPVFGVCQASAYVQVRIWAGNQVIHTETCQNAGAGSTIFIEKFVDLTFPSQIYVEARYVGFITTFMLDGDGTLTTGGISIQPTTTQAADFVVSKETIAPKVTALDYMLALQKMFNLCIRVNSIDRTVVMEPMVDYLGSGDALDWSSKVDYSQDVYHRHTSDQQSDELLYRHKPSNNSVMKQVRDATSREYTRHKLLNTANDWANGQEKIETLAEYLAVGYPTNDGGWHMPIVYNESGAAETEVGMRFGWYIHAKSEDSNGSWYLQNDSLVGVQQTLRPMLLPYSVGKNPSTDIINQAGITTDVLQYGYEPATHLNHNPHSINTLYYKFYRRLNQFMHGDEAKTVRCKMVLTIADVMRMDFTQVIRIENTNYIVLSIKGADVTLPESMCTVELLRYAEEYKDCFKIPTDYDEENDIITFDDSSTDYGTKTCCERYNYVWDDDANRCRAREIIDF